jgi:putative exosortase-associated protein (TIGR04073 family)
VLWVSAAVALCVPALRAEGGAVNTAIVKSELYVWNRIADVLEILRCGVAVGPCIGAEVAVTEKAVLGAYTDDEKGVTFPHFIPPLWLVPYAEDATVFVSHEGKYSTVAYGTKRVETSTESASHFERDTWDIRAQVGLGIAHIYTAVKTKEIGDFAAGIAGLDPSDDDAELDPAIRRAPADQFGRGVGNILFGWIELGKNMIRVGRDEGDISGFTKGLGLGLWRTGVREVVGVFELVTFPFGWSPIVEPEYVIQSAYSTDWQVNKPQFSSQY